MISGVPRIFDWGPYNHNQKSLVEKLFQVVAKEKKGLHFESVLVLLIFRRKNIVIYKNNSKILKNAKKILKF